MWRPNLEMKARVQARWKMRICLWLNILTSAKARDDCFLLNTTDYDQTYHFDSKTNLFFDNRKMRTSGQVFGRCFEATLIIVVEKGRFLC